MLQGIITVALFFVAKGLVYLGYGKKGMEARRTQGMSNKGMTFIWFIYLLILFVLVTLVGLLEDPLIALLIFVGAAIPYILWFVYARRSGSELYNKVKEEEKKLQEEYNKTHNVSSWQKLVDY